ncbi:MAG: hypothetical protein ACE5H1_06345 [Thermodesulfobacteriota bacterium]
MISFQTSRQIIIRSRVLVLLFFLVFLTTITTGCLTRQDVRGIVEQSNVAILEAQFSNEVSKLPGATLPPANPNEKKEMWQEYSAKIDTFIDKHPDRKVTTNSLRVRQAMLLLRYEQYNLAQAAFDVVDPQHLHTSRDKALYRLQNHLIWYISLNKNKITNEDFSKGENALDAFKTEIASLDQSPAIRDYLAEMRTWIALHLAISIPNSSKAETYLKDGIDNYSKIFTEEDLTALKTGKFLTKPTSIETRRILRAKSIIKYAKRVISQQNISTPQFVSNELTTLIGQ